MTDLEKYILDRVEPITESGCWIWMSSCGPGKPNHHYGDFRWKGQHRYAHRVAYEAFIGAIPHGLHVLHRCDVSLCCNPDHLFLGTNQDNIRDSMMKGRRKGISRPRPRGLKYHFTKRPGRRPKLSDEQRQAIIEAFLKGGVSKSELARKYGVSSAAVCRQPDGYLAGL